MSWAQGARKSNKEHFGMVVSGELVSRRPKRDVAGVGLARVGCRRRVWYFSLLLVSCSLEMY